MKAIKNYVILATLIVFSYMGKAQQPPSSDTYNYNTLEAQKKWIVGTFLSDEDHNWELEFTKDGKCHERFLITGNPCEYTYTIAYSTREAETPSGYVNENVYTLYLKPISPDTGPGDNPTYEMAVSDTGLALYPWGHGGQFVFSRVKTW